MRMYLAYVCMLVCMCVCVCIDVRTYVRTYVHMRMYLQCVAHDPLSDDTVPHRKAGANSGAGGARISRCVVVARGDVVVTDRVANVLPLFLTVLGLQDVLSVNTCHIAWW